MKHIDIVAESYQELHQRIFSILCNEDKQVKLIENKWKKNLGSGYTCVLENGSMIEKAGVNFSFVKGKVHNDLKTTLQIQSEEELEYGATGISSIIHSSNPLIPTIHFNVRFFELSNGQKWFGGGIDLTPMYIDIQEAKDFHGKLKTLCDKYDKTYYPEYKRWADDYFFIPHRDETRGVGGIFFDRKETQSKQEFSRIHKFTKDIAFSYPEIYTEIMRKKQDLKYLPEHKHWQKLRRGRYVEFNLIYDRGTKFGLESGGNIESILVSLPYEAAWKYNYQPKPGSEEEKTLNFLKKGIEWLSME